MERRSLVLVCADNDVPQRFAVYIPKPPRSAHDNLEHVLSTRWSKLALR
ncbi:unnamed protein product [Ixodes persulcatus]